MNNVFFPDDDEYEEPEPAWTYRGHRLSAGEFVSSMAHQYRAEVQRTNSWRTRLDVTTNWAVVLTGVSISIAFSQPNVHHGVLILNALLITSFLFVEARRYRVYEMWNYRVGTLEREFFAAMLASPFHPSPEWAENLAKSMLTPKLPISMLEAIGIRLRRNYLWIFFILGVAWFAKYWLFPAAPTSWEEFIGRAAIGSLPGIMVVIFSFAYFVFLTVIAVLTMSKTFARSSQEGVGIPSTLGTLNIPGPDRAKASQPWYRLQRRKPQFLAFIVTDKPDAVSKRIMSELKRGVTSMVGEGSTVLMCALSSKEIRNLKDAVGREDSEAVVSLSSAQEIWGKGFDPLSDE